jgi:phospholipid transport system substrate-binding protein
VRTSSVVSPLGALALLLAAAPAAVAATFPSSDVVTATAADIATTIEARRAEFEADSYALYALVDELLLPRFDMQRGCRGILAHHWPAATPADRERFVAAFYNYLVATYGVQLLHFKNDTLRVLPFDGEPTSPARVKTVLTMNDGTEVDVDFVMVETPDGWKVADVVAEGVSYVKTYRSQFSVDIDTEGFESVIAWLERKGAPRFAAAP